MIVLIIVGAWLALDLLLVAWIRLLRAREERLSASRIQLQLAEPRLRRRPRAIL
jgi:hypothetical protein